MPLSGNMAELAAYKKQLEDLGDGKAVKQVAALAQTKIDALVSKQFASATDPYGTPWAPKKDGSPALQTMRGRVTVVVEGTNIQASVEEIPGVFHQMGTVRMAQRMMIPTEGLGLPPEWQKALEDASSEVMKKNGAPEKD